MSKNANPRQADGGQNIKGQRECDRCGRERPRDPERLQVTVSDYADSTIAYEKTLLCWQCWDHIRGELERCLA